MSLKKKRGSSPKTVTKKRQTKSKALKPKRIDNSLEVLALLKAFIHFYQVQEDTKTKREEELASLAYVVLLLNLAILAFMLGVAFGVVHF